jgi:hypothetical protein
MAAINFFLILTRRYVSASFGEAKDGLTEFYHLSYNPSQIFLARSP